MLRGGHQIGPSGGCGSRAVAETGTRDLLGSDECARERRMRAAFGARFTAVSTSLALARCRFCSRGLTASQP